jgi:hypothetical protein
LRQPENLLDDEHAYTTVVVRSRPRWRRLLFIGFDVVLLALGVWLALSIIAHSIERMPSRQSRWRANAWDTTRAQELREAHGEPSRLNKLNALEASPWIESTEVVRIACDDDATVDARTEHD